MIRLDVVVVVVAFCVVNKLLFFIIFYRQAKYLFVVFCIFLFLFVGFLCRSIFAQGFCIKIAQKQVETIGKIVCATTSTHPVLTTTVARAL